ncbi:uncharacterized protein LOC113332446 [Papaver somniferum]|uniref:uncharacterized protein LOC113332446 n=1 Tax=Papaver somniferum TaxID=3469 RepID=UPI000E701C13|nr:uncharacterized protein LOC113332446 [Papaver somniferum]
MDGETDSSKGKNIECDMQKKNPVYHLGSSDGPGIIITPIVLKGTNYDEWARAIRISLIAKRKFGFVDGTITKPEYSDQLEEWIVVQSMLVSWISNTLDSSIRSSLGYYDNANLLWTQLKRRYCVVSGTRICQLKASLAECKQKKAEGVADYFGRLNKIWDEMVTYIKVPQCKCGKCTCDIASQVSMLREEDLLHYFLIGLDSVYSSVREQLLARYPLPSTDVAYQTMVNSESLRIGEVSMFTQVHDNVMAFRVQSDQRQLNNTYDPNKHCKYYSRDGHSEDGCFQRIGYPEWWGDIPRGGRGSGRGGRTNGRGRGGTNFAGGRGGRGQGAVNQVRAHNLNISDIRQSGGASSSEASGLTGVTTTQLQQVLEFLNSRKSTPQLQGNKNETVWIVDKGATNHVTYKRDDMIEIKDIKACTIGLPDGKYALSEKIGTVILPGDLRLENVLYVPRITFEVMAVSGDSYELWNWRMGHPSEKVLQKLQGRQFNKDIKIVRSDNGTEFNALRGYFRTNGIVFETSCLKVFGCLCYVHDQSSKRDKFASRGRRCVFLGYPFGKKAWQVYDLDTKEFRVSRDVKFFEHQFPFKIDGESSKRANEMMQSRFTASSATNVQGVSAERVQFSPDEYWSDDENSEEAVLAPQSGVPTETDDAGASAETEEAGVSTETDGTGSSAESESMGQRIQCDVPEKHEDNMASRNDDMGKGKRQKFPSSRLKGFVTHTIRENSLPHPHSTQSSASAGSAPRNFKEAMKHPGWRKSMEAEIRALEEQGTWELQELPPGKRALGSKWIYTEKYDENGKLGDMQLNVLVYVDDLIVAGNNLVERKYALDIIMETGLLGAKPAEFPMETNHRLALAQGDWFADVEKYRRLIGRLIYLAVNRPDLTYSVHTLSQFMQKPRMEHWEAALRVVRYLKKNPGQGILLRSNSNLSLQGWCDSDWASCPLTRRSLTGWFVCLGSSPVSWKTKKQPTVSRSSAEAEYRSMAAATCELKWLKQLLGDFGVRHAHGMKLLCDSQSALYIAQNPVFHERTKHIEISSPNP